LPKQNKTPNNQDSEKNKIDQKRIIFAPSKINLYFHIIKRLKNSYHKIDSLIAFSDIGDEITIEPYEGFSFQIEGPFATSLDQPQAPANLVITAAKSLSDITGNPLDCKITLTKNLPIAAGIGGGSSDAAATLYGLLDLWELPKNAAFMPALLKNLGADMPVCMACTPSRVTGIGEIIEEIPDLPEMPIILVNPLKQCLTKDVFMRFKGNYKNQIALPHNLHDIYDLAAFLVKQENSLQSAAIEAVPEIENIITAMSLNDGCLLSRMSGSGATVFGLFDTYEDAKNAKQHIAEDNPDWWVEAGWLNRPERY